MPIRPIMVNLSCIVDRLHRKIIYENAGWKSIIWFKTKKKITGLFGNKKIKLWKE